MKRTLGKSVSVILVLACMLSAFCIGARAVEVEPYYLCKVTKNYR